MRGNSHVRCEVGENPEMTSKDYLSLQLACASGMSFVSTDTKADVVRNYGTIASKYYGYNVSVIDLRNPTRSDENNMLHLVNKYMDVYLKDKNDLSAKAKAEKYAKITAKTIISIGGADSSAMGQNAFFYDAAEGLLASVILLLAEFGDKNERHIVSVFKLIQDLLKPIESGGKQKPKNGFKVLMEKLPDEHKAKWLAGSALHSADQAMMSIMSTALSRLNSFIDSEMEQISVLRHGDRRGMFLLREIGDIHYIAGRRSVEIFHGFIADPAALQGNSCDRR